MSRMFYAKILDLSGVTIASLSPTRDGEAAAIEFIEVASVNGESVIGQCTVDLEKVTDPKFMYQRDIQRAIKKQHRIEIYSTPAFRGTPEWTGVIVGNPSDGSMRLDCNDSSQKLAQRNTRRYDVLSGNAGTVAQNLLKTYQWVFKDRFANLDNWQFTGDGTGWTVANNTLSQSYTATGGRCQKKTNYAASAWQNAKFSFDFNFNDAAPTNQFVDFYLDYTNWHGISLNVASNSDATITLTLNGSPVASRKYPIPSDVWNHLDIYIQTSGGTSTVTVDINGFEMLVGTAALAVVASDIQFDQGVSGKPAWSVQNFLYQPLSDCLAVGTFDTTAETLTDQETSGMSNLDAIRWVARKIGFETRVNPQAYPALDTFDFKANVGWDWTDTFVFKETTDKDYPFRIVSLQKNDASEELATVLYTYGQRNDDANNSFISNDLDAIGTYGEIESQFSDERVSSVGTAKVIGDIELAKRSGDTPSYSFTIVDESRLYVQDPRWGSAVMGAFIWGGRDKLRAGDTIAVTSETLNLFKEPLKVLSLRRYGADKGSIKEFGLGDRIDVTCEYQPWRRQRLVYSLREQLERRVRQDNLSLDTQPLTFHLSGTTAEAQSFSLRGNYRKVKIDVNSASWAGAITFKIDGTDRTNALFGAATIAANKSATDTTYLTRSKVYTITLTPSATVTVRVEIRPQVRG